MIFSKKILKMGQEQSRVVIKEGSANIYIPNSIDKSEVFYNDVQVFNRDITCLVINTFINDFLQDKTKQSVKKNKEYTYKDISLFEAFAATGLRSIRYALEVKNIKRIVANDIDKQAFSVIKNNIIKNNVSDIVEASLGDANIVMSQSKSKYLIVDLDPYSTVSKFLDSAFQCIENGGMMCITSTDGRTLCGQQQESSFAWYNVMIAKTSFCHELGLRSLLKLVKEIGARYKKTVEPLLSLKADFYFRIFVRVWNRSDVSLISQFGLIFYCPASTAFYVQEMGSVSKKSEKSYKPSKMTLESNIDSISGEELIISGPVYIGPLHNKSFVKLLQDNIAEMKYLSQVPRIKAVLHSVSFEIDALFYYDLSLMAGIIKSSVPSREIVITNLEKLGYKTSVTHTQSGMLKTDAPPNIVWDILKLWYLQYEKKGIPDSGVRKNILESETKIESILFEPDEKIKERINLEKKLCKFYMNPSKNFGPKPAAKKKKK